MVSRIVKEKAISGKNCTFTAFVVEATRVAINSVNKKKDVIKK